MDGSGEGDDEEPSSSSRPSFRYRWDVFLSFRGEDTRHGITERLYNELVRNGVRTFRDDEGLERGEEIAPSLLEAIQDSAAAIAIISPNYASSRWCLEELAVIVECKLLILPVFYQVDPSHVRHQKGPFEEAFRSLELRFNAKVCRWRTAMEKAGGISGWDSRIWEESQLIQSLTEKILTKLSNTPMGVAKYPIGLNSRLEALTGLFDVKAMGVRVVGFHGMGGVGKTTLAKSIYNKLVVHFKRRSFISNIRETWKQVNGSVLLQNKFIGDLSSGALSPVNEVNKGIVLIKSLLYEEPVLVVLDDVDDVRQLNALAEKRGWFYEGSRIIITTRDKKILLECKVNELYEVKMLNSLESLQLFSYHAFGRASPPKNFMNISKQIVSLAGGLPLALEVFGSLLFDKRRIKEWEDAVQKLKQIRPCDLQDVLMISFNALDGQEKCIFLDIACLFVQMNMNREDIVDILKGVYGFGAEVAITELTAKSLVKIIENNILWMHDQLRDMGRQIVQHENLGDPGMRSRLWEHVEIMKVLKNKKGTRNIQGIVLEFEKKLEFSSEQIHRMNFKGNIGIASAVAYLKELYKKSFSHGADEEKDVTLHTKFFKPVVSLRLLQINRAKLDGNFKLMPAELKWLQWKECSLKALPSVFRLQDLAVLDLSESKIKQLWCSRWWDWKRNKVAEKLLVMNLYNCYNLTTIPNLSRHRFLEKLTLEGCRGLVRIHESVGDMIYLRYLNLKNCSNLVKFPSDVSGLKGLEKLILTGCSKLKELPDDLGIMKSLRELLADETAILKLPDSIFRLKKLEKLNLDKCQTLKCLPGCMGKLTSLRELSLDGSALETFPDSVGTLTNLEYLNLRRCSSLTAVPSSIGHLKSLIQLFLDYSSIKEIPVSIGSLSHLRKLSIGHCCSLRELPYHIEGLVSLIEFRLDGMLIRELPDQIGSLNMLEKLEMRDCEFLRSLPKSIGSLLSITTLVLDNIMITELPESIGMLERLKLLKLDKCKHLQRLPATVGRLKDLRQLFMAESAITELPEEFGLLSSLTILKMAKQLHPELPQNTGEDAKQTNISNLTAVETCMSVALPMSFPNLSSLKVLDACAWKLSGKIPDHFEMLSSLETLNLGHNNFHSLPSSLRGLSVLKYLVLLHCKELKSLPPLPPSLLELNVANCSALGSISDVSDMESLLELQLTNCRKVSDIPGLQCLKALRRLYMSCCTACFPAVKQRLSKVALKYLRYLSVPASEIPNWFVQEVPKFSCPRNREIRGLIIGVVVSLDPDPQKQDHFRDKLPDIVDVQAKIIRLNEPIYTTALSLKGVPDTNEDQLYLCRFMEFNQIVFMLKEGDRIQVGLRSTPYFKGLKLKKYGIHLIFENDDDNDDDDDDDEESLEENQKLFSSGSCTKAFVCSLLRLLFAVFLPKYLSRFYWLKKRSARNMIFSGEPELIQFLVKRVLTELRNTPVHVARYVVGLDTLVEGLMGQFDVKSSAIQVWGFHGTGGIGKTTLAKALYNKLVIHFEFRCFISSVRETSAQQNGLVVLQNKLICELSLGMVHSVDEYNAGIIAIKEIVHKQRVLVVFDDVDDVSQLDALAGSLEWFCQGSRIIITTRNQEILHKHKVNKLHEVKELDSSDSLRLFSYYALGREKPTEDFYNLSKQIVSLTGGLPLALEVFGSFLFYQRNIKEWEDAMLKLKLIRPYKLQDLLKISFDGLDKQEKCVFLDIACLFVQMRMKREDIIDILKGCGFRAETTIEVLTARSLIKITEDNELWMHDQVRDMGRQIVLDENHMDPGKRSRLWDRAEITRVLKGEMGTRYIQGIVLDFEKKNSVNHLSVETIARNDFWRTLNLASALTYLMEKFKNYFHRVAEEDRGTVLCTKSFKTMLTLRLLQINHAKLEGNFKFIPAELKWIKWKGCPLKSLPPDFFPQELAILNLSESQIKQVWSQRWWSWHGEQVARNLMVLNLRGCSYLVSIPDLSGHQALEKLILEHCTGLRKIHKSVGDLTALRHLNLRGCSNLVELPSDVSGLKKLDSLILSSCSKLKQLPEDLSSMKLLRVLLIDGTAITKLPESIFHLTKLETLNLSGCQFLTRLPICIGKLYSLRELSLFRSAIEELPASIGFLTKLEKLDLAWCKSLTAIPNSIGNLKALTEVFLNGSSVKELPASVSSLSFLKNLSVGNCLSLSNLPVSIEGLASVINLQLDGTSIKYLPDQISGLKMLEKLEMRNCECLTSLPESIGSILTLSSLIIVNAAITELPESIGLLENLTLLRLNKCKQLCRLPTSIGKLRSLYHLHMEESAVAELPESFWTLSSLIILRIAKRPHMLHLNIRHTEPQVLGSVEKPKPVILPAAISNLSSLNELDARAWKISGKIPDDFEKLSSLEILNLGDNNFFSLPRSLSGLSFLKELLLSRCKELKSLPPLPSSLLVLNAANCTALESIFDLSNLENLRKLHLTNCEKLVDIPGLECLKSLRELDMTGCSSCSSMAKEKLYKDMLKQLHSLSIPGTEIPDWFSQGVVRFSNRKNHVIKGVIIGVVVSVTLKSSDDLRLPIIPDFQAEILRLNKSICNAQLNLLGVPKMHEDQLYLCRYFDHQPLVFNLNDGDRIHVITRKPPVIEGVELKKCGVHLVFENDDDYERSEDLLNTSQQSVSGKLAIFFSHFKRGSQIPDSMHEVQNKMPVLEVRSSLVLFFVALSCFFLLLSWLWLRF